MPTTHKSQKPVDAGQRQLGTYHEQANTGSTQFGAVYAPRSLRQAPSALLPAPPKGHFISNASFAEKWSSAIGPAFKSLRCVFGHNWTRWMSFQRSGRPKIQVRCCKRCNKNQSAKAVS
jgi:hypothetical protein